MVASALSIHGILRYRVVSGWRKKNTPGFCNSLKRSNYRDSTIHTEPENFEYNVEWKHGIFTEKKLRILLYIPQGIPYGGLFLKN